MLHHSNTLPSSTSSSIYSKTSLHGPFRSRLERAIEQDNQVLFNWCRNLWDGFRQLNLNTIDRQNTIGILKNIVTVWPTREWHHIMTSIPPKGHQIGHFLQKDDILLLPLPFLAYSFLLCMHASGLRITSRSVCLLECGTGLIELVHHL